MRRSIVHFLRVLSRSDSGPYVTDLILSTSFEPIRNISWMTVLVPVYRKNGRTFREGVVQERNIYSSHIPSTMKAQNIQSRAYLELTFVNITLACCYPRGDASQQALEMQQIYFFRCCVLLASAFVYLLIVDLTIRTCVGANAVLVLYM
ncbi:hypothetical protein PILCRDRAFT_185593 [Piloderma croceum F 1598]|uniref:Uncharacterized protein n=1 Tax=Piloderma croceum (strain F 1598) TaxID=765440 RepID=A0A0C3GFP5_PILCF|nr:hypothetical protein PILCRDRAFT_185593 [Piloderma croceum F 1598]